MGFEQPRHAKRGCSAASWRRCYVPAVPEPRGCRRLLPAGASRTSAGACAVRPDAPAAGHQHSRPPSLGRPARPIGLRFRFTNKAAVGTVARTGRPVCEPHPRARSTAYSDSGTRRSFDPFPTTCTRPPSRSSPSVVRVVTSLTRRPEPYSNSRIARSRRRDGDRDRIVLGSSDAGASIRARRPRPPAGRSAADSPPSGRPSSSDGSWSMRPVVVAPIGRTCGSRRPAARSRRARSRARAAGRGTGAASRGRRPRGQREAGDAGTSPGAADRCGRRSRCSAERWRSSRRCATKASISCTLGCGQRVVDGLGMPRVLSRRAGGSGRGQGVSSQRATADAITRTGVGRYPAPASASAAAAPSAAFAARRYRPPVPTAVALHRASDLQPDQGGHGVARSPRPAARGTASGSIGSRSAASTARFRSRAARRARPAHTPPSRGRGRRAGRPRPRIRRAPSRISSCGAAGQLARHRPREPRTPRARAGPRNPRCFACRCGPRPPRSRRRSTAPRSAGSAPGTGTAPPGTPGGYSLTSVPRSAISLEQAPVGGRVHRRRSPSRARPPSCRRRRARPRGRARRSRSRRRS